jgi:phage repressor protein C with HTH and peptisase S24 domain
MPDNQSKKDRINLALGGANKSQRDLAKHMGKSSPAVSEMLGKDGDPPVSYLEATAEITGYRLEWLMTGEGHQTISASAVNAAMMKEPDLEYLSGKKIRVVTVAIDKKDRELMTYVPVRAQAGYMKGHGDPHYIEKLPAFSLPILKEGSYRMFEVDGESMLQVGGGGLHDGDIVIAQYLEDIFSMRDNRVYVVVSKDGVVVKRCLNRLKEKDNPVLVCKSDNKNGQHKDIIIRPPEIIEVWELKAFISKQLSFATDIWQILTDVQVQVALMDEKIKRISDERLLPG